MSEYNEGDLIEAVKGDTVIRGRLRGSGIAGFRDLWVGDYTRLVSILPGAGYALTVIEKAKPKLPEEPGVYVDKDGDPWKLPDESGTLRPEYAPYTRVEPVAETAKKVLDRVSEILPGPFPNEFVTLAAEFGVQS